MKGLRPAPGEGPSGRRGLMKTPGRTAPPGSARISPTAYYTGHVWVRNGLAPPAFHTRRGQALFAAVEPLARMASRWNGGVRPESMLLQRHGLIDHLLRRFIEEDGCRTVLELGCGLSARGWRFERAFGDRVLYIEADLPAMAARKRSILERHAGARPDRHRVVPVDMLETAGDLSLESAVGPLLSGSPVAVVTEGLVNYFPKEVLVSVWRRLMRLAAPAGGRYVSDLHLRSLVPPDVSARAWIRMIGLFTRGNTYLDFLDPADTEDTLRRAGFEDVVLHDPHDHAVSLGLPRTGARSLFRVLEARLIPGQGLA